MVPGMDESRRWACFSRTSFLVSRCPTRPCATATRPRCEGCTGNEMETNAPFGNEDGNEPKKGGGDGNEKGQKEGVLVAVGNAAPASAGRAGGEQSPKPAEPQVASADKVACTVPVQIAPRSSRPFAQSVSAPIPLRASQLVSTLLTAQGLCGLPFASTLPIAKRLRWRLFGPGILPPWLAAGLDNSLAERAVRGHRTGAPAQPCPPEVQCPAQFHPGHGMEYSPPSRLSFGMP
jgi:hypothetical protein